MRFIDSTGFNKPTYPEILLEYQDLAREKYGEDINMSSNTPLGKLLELLAYREYEMIEDIEALYNSKFIFKSSGQALIDNLADRLITPRDATKASGQLKIVTTDRVGIRRGTLFRGGNAGGLYQTLRNYQFMVAGEHYIEVESLEYGDAGNAMPNTINVIVNPVRNLESVTNPEAFVNGQDEETDEELKDRYERSRAISGSRRLEAIEANILQTVEGINDVIALENVEMVEVNGIPPKSIYIIYDGGDGKDVAHVVYEKKAAGIKAHGSEEYTFENDKGIENTIGVTPAERKDIYVRVTVLVGRDYDDAKGEDDIKRATYEYIGGYYGDTKYRGVSMGDTIYATQIESSVNCSTSGILDITAELSLDGENYERVNITSEPYESFNVRDVEVVINRDTN